MQGTKKKSKRWSMKDIRTIKKFVLTAKNEGMEEHVGLQAAATHFGVTLNSVTLRWRRFHKGIATKTLKRKTTKVPMERKKRKYTKKKFSPAMLEAIQGKAVTEVNTYVEKQSMTRELRKMVIDLMNTSGHIKAVSVDLSNRSFTVIY